MSIPMSETFTQSAPKNIIPSDKISELSWHLRVLGAYVQKPNPAIHGFQDDTVIISNDANALYPISIVHQNLGFDTISGRVYDTGAIQNIVGLIEKVFSIKNQPGIIESAVSGFTSAIEFQMKDFFTRKTTPNKKERLEFNKEYYSELLRKILSYDGKIEDIYTPINDRTYLLLKSCMYPLFEAISWLSPHNKGYNNTIVDYVFYNEIYMKKYNKKLSPAGAQNPVSFYYFENINSTKTRFKKMGFEDGVSLFKTKILNPYGVLIDKHKDNLAFDVPLIKEGLRNRSVIKDRALMLGAIYAKKSHFTEKEINIFINPRIDNKFLSDDQANFILDFIHDSEDRTKRISSLTSIEFTFNIESPGTDTNKKLVFDFIKLREEQFMSMQEGIKVTLNTLYGIYGLISWQYASPLIGNAITSAGKIYGIKLFQMITNDIIQDLTKRLELGETIDTEYYTT